MAKFLYKIGTFTAKHKWLSIVLWIAVLAALVITMAVKPP